MRRPNPDFELAFRKVEPALGVHDVCLRSVEHDDTADFPGHRAPVLEVPGVGRIRHAGTWSVTASAQ